MGTMTPDELARLWREEKLSLEMAVGHITQNLVQIQRMIDTQRQLLHSSLEQQRQLLLTLQEALPNMGAPTSTSSPKKRRSS